jgi:glucosyl-dolichyl phosphate glucuronosyltransferase
MTHPPRLSAVICTYDRYDVLPDTIRAVAGQTPPGGMELLVIDNSPDAGRSAAEAARLNLPGVIWLHEAKPGLSNARNVGLSRARGEVIAYLDDDAIAAPDWAPALLEAFDAFSPEIAVVGGKVVPLFRSERPAWLSDKLMAQLSMVDLGDQRRPLKPGEWVVGANIAYRTQALRDIGGFSTNLGRIGAAGLLSAEETDVANRLKAKGFFTGYDPHAWVQHLVDASRTTQSWFARRTAWQAVSAVLSGEATHDRTAALTDIRHYFAALPPADRTALALLKDQDRPGDLDWQLGTIYNLVVLLMAEGRAA